MNSVFKHKSPVLRKIADFVGKEDWKKWKEIDKANTTDFGYYEMHDLRDTGEAHNTTSLLRACRSMMTMAKMMRYVLDV
jgi:hypothetical protein